MRVCKPDKIMNGKRQEQCDYVLTSLWWCYGNIDWKRVCVYSEFLAGMQIHVDIHQRKKECIVPTQLVHIHLILSRVEAINLFKFIKLFSVTNIAQLCRNPLVPHKLPHLSPFLPPSSPSPAIGELPVVVLHVLSSHWHHGQHKHTRMYM